MAVDFDLQIATSGAQGLTYASQSTPDLILLDVMMPEMDGFEVCLRENRLHSSPVHGVRRQPGTPTDPRHGAAEDVRGCLSVVNKFDGALDPDEVEAHAIALGDYLSPTPYRKYARVWLKPDYDESVAASAVTAAKKVAKALEKARAVDELTGEISAAYASAMERD